MHGVSHHLGLDVHDPVNYDLPITLRKVLTIEPGIYKFGSDLNCKKSGFYPLSVIVNSFNDDEMKFHSMCNIFSKYLNKCNLGLLRKGNNNIYHDIAFAIMNKSLETIINNNINYLQNLSCLIYCHDKNLVLKLLNQKNDKHHTPLSIVEFSRNSYTYKRKKAIIKLFGPHDKRYFRELNKKKCNTCDKEVPKKKKTLCQGCELTYYCSKRCQKIDWKTKHKDHCTKVVDGNINHNGHYFF